MSKVYKAPRVILVPRAIPEKQDPKAIKARLAHKVQPESKDR